MEVWLYIRKLDDGSIKYYLCDEDKEAKIDDIRIPANMRWMVEHGLNECRNHLGLENNEARSWPAWRRHILLTFISHLFVNKLRRKLSFDIKTSVLDSFMDVQLPSNDYRDDTLNLQNE
jgi:SRSO17 transposase